jgi:hypothetical protein
MASSSATCTNNKHKNKEKMYSLPSNKDYNNNTKEITPTSNTKN